MSLWGRLLRNGPTVDNSKRQISLTVAALTLHAGASFLAPLSYGEATTLKAPHPAVGHNSATRRITPTTSIKKSKPLQAENANRSSAASTKELVRAVALVNGALTFVERTNQSLRPDCVKSNGYIFATRTAHKAYTAAQKRKNVLTVNEAKRLFAFLRDQKHIPFHYPEDGCYARAHEMARILELNGVTSRKVFIFGNLSVKTNWAPSGATNWWYHVAPTVKVRLANKTEEDWVIDPSILNDPKPINNWATLQTTAKCEDTTSTKDGGSSGSSECTYRITERFTYTPSALSDSPTDWLEADSENADATMKQYLKIAREREERRSKSETI
jgi:hypothetical protein